MGATSGAGTVYPSYVSSPHDFSGVRVFCRSFFVPLSFLLLAIVLSVLLRFTDSDYPFNLVSSNSSYGVKLNSEMVTIFDILKAHRTKHLRDIPT